MADDFFDQMQVALGGLVAKAEDTGETQTLSLSSNGWRYIVKNGKVTGRFRFEGAEITITPKAKRKRKAVANLAAARKETKP